MKEGTVKFFNNEKGFGFIKPDGASEDIFVHVNGLIDEIRDKISRRLDIESQVGRRVDQLDEIFSSSCAL